MGSLVTTRDQLRAAMALVVGTTYEHWQADALEKELWRRGLMIVDRYGRSDSPHLGMATTDTDSAGLDRSRRTIPPKEGA